jgi:hypothetical protein
MSKANPNKINPIILLKDAELINPTKTKRTELKPIFIGLALGYT